MALISQQSDGVQECETRKKNHLRPYHVRVWWCNIFILSNVKCRKNKRLKLPRHLVLVKKFSFEIWYRSKRKKRQSPTFTRWSQFRKSFARKRTLSGQLWNFACNDVKGFCSRHYHVQNQCTFVQNRKNSQSSYFLFHLLAEDISTQGLKWCQVWKEIWPFESFSED